MICAKCGEEDYVLRDGLCRKCIAKNDEPVAKNDAPFRPPKRLRGRPAGSYLPKTQLKETKRLQAKCVALMDELGMPRYKFASYIGTTRSAFYRWLHGEFSMHHQPRFNAKIAERLKEMELLK